MPNTDPPTGFNELAGQNVARYRRAAGLSQAALAQFLTEHGFPLQQQTVLKIENGSRPLKFAEALALADVLGVPVGELGAAHDPSASLRLRWNENAAAQARAQMQRNKLLEEIQAVDRELSELAAEAAEIEHQVRSTGVDTSAFRGSLGRDAGRKEAQRRFGPDHADKPAD